MAPAAGPSAPGLELGLKSSELKLDMRVLLPVGSERMPFKKVLTTLASLGLCGKGYDFSVEGEVSRFEQETLKRETLYREQFEFYSQVELRFAEMAETLLRMKRDYYREIDHLREQISKGFRDPDNVVFFDPDLYRLPSWEDIVEQLDGYRMKRELLRSELTEKDGRIKQVPINMLCTGCRKKFQTPKEAATVYREEMRHKEVQVNPDELCPVAARPEISPLEPGVWEPEPTPEQRPSSPTPQQPPPPPSPPRAAAVAPATAEEPGDFGCLSSQRQRPLRGRPSPVQSPVPKDASSPAGSGAKERSTLEVREFCTQTDDPADTPPPPKVSHAWKSSSGSERASAAKKAPRHSSKEPNHESPEPRRGSQQHLEGASPDKGVIDCSPADSAVATGGNGRAPSRGKGKQASRTKGHLAVEAADEGSGLHPSRASSTPPLILQETADSFSRPGTADGEGNSMSSSSSSSTSRRASGCGDGMGSTGGTSGTNGGGAGSPGAGTGSTSIGGSGGGTHASNSVNGSSGPKTKSPKTNRTCEHRGMGSPSPAGDMHEVVESRRGSSGTDGGEQAVRPQKRKLTEDELEERAQVMASKLERVFSPENAASRAIGLFKQKLRTPKEVAVACIARNLDAVKKHLERAAMARLRGHTASLRPVFQQLDLREAAPATMEEPCTRSWQGRYEVHSWGNRAELLGMSCGPVRAPNLDSFGQAAAGAMYCARLRRSRSLVASQLTKQMPDGLQVDLGPRPCSSSSSTGVGLGRTSPGPRGCDIRDAWGGRMPLGRSQMPGRAVAGRDVTWAKLPWECPMALQDAGPKVTTLYIEPGMDPSDPAKPVNFNTNLEQMKAFGWNTLKVPRDRRLPPAQHGGHRSLIITGERPGSSHSGLGQASSGGSPGPRIHSKHT